MISKCLCFLNRGDNGPRSQMEGLQQCSVWANTSVVNRLRFGYSPTSTRLRKSLLVTALNQIRTRTEIQSTRTLRATTVKISSWLAKRSPELRLALESTFPLPKTFCDITIHMAKSDIWCERWTPGLVHRPTLWE